jgi:demethylmenaquinone methyltransferase/2-methoxy-6-polyprenyl-1,4-benzoquinol methylase
VVHGRYLVKAMPRLATLASSNPEAYRYLAESMQAWPTQPELAGWIAAAGWDQVGWRNLTGGIVAVHRAHNPG